MLLLFRPSMIVAGSCGVDLATTVIIAEIMPLTASPKIINKTAMSPPVRILPE